MRLASLTLAAMLLASPSLKAAEKCDIRKPIFILYEINGEIRGAEIKGAIESVPLSERGYRISVVLGTAALVDEVKEKVVAAGRVERVIPCSQIGFISWDKFPFERAQLEAYNLFAAFSQGNAARLKLKLFFD